MQKKEKISILRHDFRSSLTSIKEAISLVRDGTLGKINKEQKRCLSVANEGIERAVKMIDKFKGE